MLEHRVFLAHVARVFLWMCLVAAGGCGSNANPTATEAAFPCESASPRRSADGEPTGYVTCAGGRLHRAEALACAQAPGGEGAEANTQVIAACVGKPSTCTAHSDCTEGAYGYCSPAVGPFASGAAPCACHYGCASDDDCEEGSICDCRSPNGVCRPTVDCRTDADCNGGLCADYWSSPGCFDQVAFACQTDEDECLSDEDCKRACSGERCDKPLCTHDGSKRVCAPARCVH